MNLSRLSPCWRSRRFSGLSALASSSVGRPGGADHFGLRSSLVGHQGVWWSLSWIALAVPLIVIAWHWLRSTGRKGMRDARRHSS